jgi:hypothetical protein
VTGNCSETTGDCFEDDEGHWETTENSTGDGNGPGENCLQQDWIVSVSTTGYIYREQTGH